MPPKKPNKARAKPAKKKQPAKQKSRVKKRDRRTVEQKRIDFIEEFAETCDLQVAAKRAGIGRRTHYHWLEQDEAYAQAFEKVRRQAGEHLESEAVIRATTGWLEPVHYQGRVCGHVRRFDGGLLQFLLRGILPEKYGNKTEISGPQGAPVQARVEVVFVKPGDTDTDCK